MPMSLRPGEARGTQKARFVAGGLNCGSEEKACRPGRPALQGGKRRPPQTAAATSAREPQEHSQDWLCYRRQMRLDAGAGGVGPFELHGVGAELLCFPGADVADFAVVVVVPALAGNGIGDG